MIHSAAMRVPDLRARHHPRCFVCDPSHPLGFRLEFSLAADGAVTADFRYGEGFEGYPGLVHGGIAALLLDGAMTNCLFQNGLVALTADLHIRYRHPLRTDHPATVRAHIARSNPPLFVVAAEIVQDARVTTTAEGKFMQTEANSTPSEAQ